MGLVGVSPVSVEVACINNNVKIFKVLVVLKYFSFDFNWWNRQKGEKIIACLAVITQSGDKSWKQFSHD